MDVEQTKYYAIVVDDDPFQLRFLAELTRKAGLTPCAFTGVAEALNYMKSAANAAADGNSDMLPVLVVTDVDMPGIDGWCFCRLLRSPEYPDYNKVPIMVISATLTGNDAVQISLENRADAFVPVPVDADQFVMQAQALLKGQRIKIARRVLLAEDTDLLAGALERLFVRDGDVVKVTHTLEDALSAISGNNFDIAVIDYHLPDGKGDALLENFRARQPDCVCLMMTADPDPELALAWMRKGAAAYLRKPFKGKYLLDLCGKVCRERSLLRIKDILDERTDDLRKSEDMYRTLVEVLPDVVMRFDRAGRYLFVSQNIRQCFGVSPEKFAGKTHADLGYPDDHCRIWMNMLKRAFKSEKAFETDLPCRCKNDRSVCNIRFVPEKDEQGMVSSVLCVCRDITAQHLGEQELLRINAAIDAASDAIGMMDCDGKHFYHNQAFEKLFGYKPSEISSPHIFYANKHDSDAVFANLMAGNSWNGEVEMVSRAGRRFPVLLRTDCVKDKNGKTIAMIGIHSDVSERKKNAKIMVEISSREREKLSRDLHDSICQQVSAVGFLAKKVASNTAEISPPNALLAGKIGDIVNKTMDNLDSIITGFMPVANRPGAFEATLQKLVVYIASVYNVNCRLSPGVIPAESGETASQLYLIAQEAVFNAVKHAGCSNIVIAFVEDDSGIVMTVADDGCGISKNKKVDGKGQGVDIMKARASLIDADLAWGNAAKSGTVVTCIMRKHE